MYNENKQYSWSLIKKGRGVRNGKICSKKTE